MPAWLTREMVYLAWVASAGLNKAERYTVITGDTVVTAKPKSEIAKSSARKKTLFDDLATQPAVSPISFMFIHTPPSGSEGILWLHKLQHKLILGLRWLGCVFVARVGRVAQKIAFAGPFKTG